MVNRQLAFLSEKKYDLLVIGGGINGAAIAHMAAKEGLRVVLVEKGDFASGASSKSTKLVHGGLRYLENLEIDLVRESLRERFIQTKSLPYLVHPLGFVVPTYKTDRVPFWMMRFGIALYDWLSGKYILGKHRSLTKDEVLESIPGLQPEGLIGGVLYYDAQMDDARVCLENVLAARAHGADVVNYCEVTAFLKEKGKVFGVRARDCLSSQEFEIKANKVVCATGPWTNILREKESQKNKKRIRTTKGVHFVYKEKVARNAILFQTQKDARIFFVIPWGDHSLVGTTDTDYSDNPDDVKVEKEDIAYLFSELKRFFPKRSFQESDIIASFAGLRPLVWKKGHPAKVSRNHLIEQTAGGVVYVLGGKFTTYRKIAQDCLKKILPGVKGLQGVEYPLYGSGAIEESVDEVVREYGVDGKTVEYLQQKYGIRYKEILRLIKQDISLKEKICDCSLAVRAQVVYAVENEMACTVDDIIWRRLGLGYLGCSTGRCRQVVEQYF